MLEHFEPQIALGMAAPCFIRKVDTMSDCGHDEQIPEHRVPQILAKVLKVDADGCISTYYIESSLALARIALAINESLGRRSITQDLILVPLSVQELEGINRAQTNGDSLCQFARKRHWDLKPTDAQRQVLARALADRQAVPLKLKDTKLKKAKTELEQQGCRSVVRSSTACKCDQ